MCPISHAPYLTHVTIFTKQGVAVGKTSTAEEVKDISRMLTELESKHRLPVASIKLIPAVETCLGIVNAYGICNADAQRIIGVAFGADDCTCN